MGLLEDGPKHGYQLKKLMREISDTFGMLKTDSIYYPLRKMLKDKFVTQAKTQEGRRPPRLTYKITPKGREEFHKLVLSNLLKIQRPYFSVDLSLYFLNHIPKDQRQHYLKIRLKLLERLSKGLRQFKSGLTENKTSHLVDIVDHNQQLLDAEIKFIERLSSI